MPGRSWVWSYIHFICDIVQLQELSLAKLNTNPVSFQDLCADARLQFSSPDMSCLDTLTTQNMAKLNFAGVRLMSEHQWILGVVVRHCEGEWSWLRIVTLWIHHLTQISSMFWSCTKQHLFSALKQAFGRWRLIVKILVCFRHSQMTVLIDLSLA